MQWIYLVRICIVKLTQQESKVILYEFINNREYEQELYGAYAV